MVLIERAERGECSEGNSEKSEIIEESEVRIRFYKVKSEGCEGGGREGCGRDAGEMRARCMIGSTVQVNNHLSHHLAPRPPSPQKTTFRR